jgi:NDP-sugar pyrophosphorylase family protein
MNKDVNLRDWPVAILAGGLATRLRPLTTELPKALIPVAGEPFLRHQLRLLYSRGFRRIVLCVGYLGELIRAEFGKSTLEGIAIEYSFDGPQLLGTGGALKRALSKLDDRFFVLYGDSYLPIDYTRVAHAFLASGKQGLMTVFKNENRWDKSNVEFDGAQIRRYDKMRPSSRMLHIDYGVGVLNASALANRPDDTPFDLADVYSQLLRENQLSGFGVAERFYEIGSPSGLKELEQVLTRKFSPASHELL